MKKLIVNSIMVVIVTPFILLLAYSFAYETLLIKMEVSNMNEKVIDVNYEYPKELKACDFCGVRVENINIKEGMNNKIFICDECILKEDK